MPDITISDDSMTRITAFKPVVEALLNVSLDFTAYVEILLHLAPDFILTEAFSGADVPTLLHTIQVLGQDHPEEVYNSITQLLDRGMKMVQDERREELKRKLGFKLPEDEQESSQ